MKVLSLDPATKTGWAHSSGPSGTFDLSIRKDESSGMRLIRLRGKLTEIRVNCGVNLVVFESAVVYGAKHASGVGVAYELQSVIKVWCEDHKIQYRGYTPQEVKKHATGKGVAPKEKMLELARDKWGDHIHDHNQADALWLLDLAKKEYAE